MIKVILSPTLCSLLVCSFVFKCNYDMVAFTECIKSHQMFARTDLHNCMLSDIMPRNTYTKFLFVQNHEEQLWCQMAILLERF